MFRSHLAVACTVLVSVLLGICAAAPAAAQSGSLYGASISESAVLVRVMNAQDEGPVSFRLGPARLTADEPGAVTAYAAVAADIYVLRYLGSSVEFIPERNTLYTIVAAGDAGLSILNDTRHDDTARSQIYLYASADNGCPVELRTADGAALIIAGVEPGGSAFRTVNTVRAAAAVFGTDGTKLSADFQLDPVRGGSFTVLVLPPQADGGLYRVFASRAGIEDR